jgi:hypothetical protein
MFDNNFDTVHAPDTNVKIIDTMDRLFKTNSFKYEDPFRNEHTYLFSHGGIDINLLEISFKMNINTLPQKSHVQQLDLKMNFQKSLYAYEKITGHLLYHT